MFAIVLVALGFVIAVLLIGTPVALIVRGLHGGFSWVAQLRGDASPFGEALVAVSSIAGGVILTAVFVRLLDGLIDWRWKFRARVISARTTRTSIDHHDIAEAV